MHGVSLFGKTAFDKYMHDPTFHAIVNVAIGVLADESIAVDEPLTEREMALAKMGASYALLAQEIYGAMEA